MCGSGVKTCMFPKVLPACCAAVVGATARGSVECRPLTTATWTTGTSALASASSFPSEPLPKDLKQERSEVLAANGKAAKA